jgi:hypothetical protein
MACSRRIEPADVPWLMGPYGEVDVIADTYLQRLADDQGLTLQRHTAGAGLTPDFDTLALPAEQRQRLAPQVVDFYEHTADYELDVWSRWNPLFRPGASLIRRLYSRRLAQLNLPLDPLDTSRGITSEIVTLTDPASGHPQYTVWYRTLKATGEVIYSGVYASTQLPDGRPCVKVVFPLPRGSATVMLAASVTPDGGLELVSSGRRFGDAGFYFLLRDRRGRHFSQYIRSLRERITVYVDDEQVLRADHRLSLWRRPMLTLHYRMTRREPGPPGALTGPGTSQSGGRRA